MPSCQDCRYFVPHRRPRAVRGHCVMPRPKLRRPEDAACLRFCPRPAAKPGTRKP